MSNEDLFKLAREKHLQKKKSVEFEKRDYQKILYAKLMPQNYGTRGYVQVRFLGNPMEFRNGCKELEVPADNTSSKIIHQSWILSDDLTRRFPVIWPSREENPSWILYRAMDKVLDATWDSVSNSRRYLNQEKHPELFTRVFKNNNTKNPYERGWYPKAMVVANVIDRNQMDLHKAEKHAFILTKASEGKNRDSEGNLIEYIDGGVAPLVYDSLMQVVGEVGDFNRYDVVIKRTEASPFYQVFHGSEKLRFSDFPFFRKEYIEAPLTEEELSWKRYNIDELYPVTSYSVLLAKLRLFFTQFDREFGTSLLDELQELADKENKEDTQSKVEEVKEEAKATVRRPVTNVNQEEKGDTRRSELAKAGYKHQDRLSDENLDLIASIEDGEIIWVDDIGDLFECEACDTMSPGEFSYCPKCGAFFG